MTFLSWRRELVLAAVDRALEAGHSPAADPMADPAGAGALGATQAWDRLHRELASSLPPQEIRAALDELVSSRRHHCQARQLALIERLRQQACAQAAAGQAPARQSTLG
jgi:hypothetical protein